ncbi:MAG: glycosyl hydrolase 53 family protein [Bacilli bacterium]|nr:glycosyl hydrolase 53 family protein [Bacilli bacterium]
MLLGIDVSTYFDEQQAGAKYFANGVEIDPLEEFKKQGVSHVRIRLWNHPYDEDGHPYSAGTCDTDLFLKLASLVVEKYGYRLILDFHYSDFWADPIKQFCPKAWEKLTFEEVCKALYDFTKATLIKAKEKNLPIDFIQIGNETTNGMSYPFGQLSESFPRSGYDRLSTLFKNGIKAVKEIYPEARSIIHLENSQNQEKYREYFDALTRYKVDYDIIGMSYYPYWHDSFDALFANIKMCQKRYQKPVMIMETGYAFTLEDYINDPSNVPHLAVNNTTLDLTKHLPYPLNEEGQAKFIKKLLELAKENDVIGVCYWEPLWIPGEGICWASDASLKYIHQEGIKSLRNEWSNQCFFDYKGNMLKAFKEFKK